MAVFGLLRVATFGFAIVRLVPFTSILLFLVVPVVAIVTLSFVSRFQRKDREDVAKDLVLRARNCLHSPAPADVAAGLSLLSTAVDRAPWLARSLQELRARALMRLQRYEDVVVVLGEYIPGRSPLPD